MLEHIEKILLFYFREEEHIEEFVGVSLRLDTVDPRSARAAAWALFFFEKKKCTRWRTRVGERLASRDDRNGAPKSRP